jgi:hypothetical protein
MCSRPIQPATQDLDCAVREATLHDFSAISDVVRRNGLTSTSYDVFAGLWNDNPFRSELTVPLGWVLENKAQEIVGTLSNIGRMYIYNGEPVRVASASAWAVDPLYRTSAVFLAKQFFSQKNVDLFLNTTASDAAAEVFKAFRCSEIPDPSFTQVLYWITGYAGFAGSALRKLNIPLIPGLRHAAATAFYCRDLMRPGRVRLRPTETCVLDGFDERFDEFWNLLRHRRDRLLAVRTAEALTWQFRPALENGSASIIALLEGKTLSGYLILMRGDDDRIGLRRFRVIDIQTIRDEPDIILSLMRAALEHARRSGVDVVEAVGFHRSKRDVLEQMNPHHRTYPSCPYLYKVKANYQPLQDALRNPDAWDASQFDGDASF